MSTQISTESKTTSTTVTRRTPLLPGVIGLGSELAGRSVTISFDLAQDIRGELRSAADTTLGYADSMARSALGLTRSIVARVDEFVSTSLEQGKATALALVSSAQRTGAQASGMSADAWNGAVRELFGQGGTPPAA